jgi:uncharacterized protein (TIGR03437 family)
VTAPKPNITGIINAASGVSGRVSPGEVVTLFGTNLGPAARVLAQLDATGKIATTLGNVQVLFNGIPGPMVYAGAAQTSAIAPYEIAGAITVNVQLTYLGGASNTIPMTGVSTVPGVFTANLSGTGPAAAFNQDNHQNTSATPANKGDIVTIYITGEGQTQPAGVTGKITTLSTTGNLTPQPLLPVAVTLDGAGTFLQFWGEVPNIVSGVLQINFQVPLTARSGDLPVVVSVGGNSSQAGVTISVR